MTKIIVYGFKTWNAATGRYESSTAKADIETIESMGAWPLVSEVQAVDEQQLDSERLYHPPVD